MIDVDPYRRGFCSADVMSAQMARGTSGVLIAGRKEGAKKRLDALKEAEARAAEKVKAQVEGYLTLFDADSSGMLERPEVCE